jgi:magnesium-transporting ATPase (P-type)
VREERREHDNKKKGDLEMKWILKIIFIIFSLSFLSWLLWIIITSNREGSNPAVGLTVSLLSLLFVVIVPFAYIVLFCAKDEDKDSQEKKCLDSKDKYKKDPD